MLFRATAPRPAAAPNLRRLIAGHFRAYLLALGLCTAAAPALAQDFDLLLHPGGDIGGAVTAGFDFGAVHLSAGHNEFIGILNPRYGDSDAEEANVLLRSSRFAGAAAFEIGDGLSLPSDFEVSFDVWSSGQRDVSLNARNGVLLPGVALGHSLTLATALGTGGEEEVRGNGSFSLAAEVFGGSQTAAIDYDALPLSRVAAFHFTSDWGLEDGSAVTLNFSHRVEDGFSEARFGLRQNVGIFDMTADFAADNVGAFAIGLNFALPLGETEAPAVWSLGDLLAGLRQSGDGR